MLYFSKIQDDSYRTIAPISCTMPSFHKPNLTDIFGCVVISQARPIPQVCGMGLVCETSSVVVDQRLLYCK